MSKDDGSAKFVAGAILGAIVGGIAALLLSPKTGKQHRQAVKEQAQKTIHTTDARLDQIEAELEGRITNLKSAARDLKGEAYEDSQRLITRAEVLKNDLRDSASRLASAGRWAKQGAADDAKRLVGDGRELLGELENMTKKIIRSARDRAAGGSDGSDDSNPSD